MKNPPVVPDRHDNTIFDMAMIRRNLLLNIFGFASSANAKSHTIASSVGNYPRPKLKYPPVPIAAVLAGVIEGNSGISVCGFVKKVKGDWGDSWLLFDSKDSAMLEILPNSIELIKVTADLPVVANGKAYNAHGKLIDRRPVAAFHEIAFGLEFDYVLEIPKPN